MSYRTKTASFILACSALVTGSAEAPLQYLTGSGEKAAPVVDLTRGVLAISLLVIVVICALLIGAIWHRRADTPTPDGKNDLGSPEGGLNWLWIGVGISTAVLLFAVVWTVVVLAKIGVPANAPKVTIEVTGRQWWWQVRYISPDPAQIFTTANEIHLPAGEPVRFKLIGGDVIHSFWVPQLSGKVDTIPGQTNETWLEAKSPGTYRGQCTEYCGLQHAHMGFLVIADSPADFRKWWAHQLQPPSSAGSSGAALFEAHCGGCHAVRGTDAQGEVGPDLSHLMTRSTIASAVLPNTSEELARWISNPQSIKPGSLMPTPELSGDGLASIESYLHTLN